MGVYGIAVFGFFSSGISVILILTCGIAVSSSSAVCGFSSFWLTVFGEIGLFTVLMVFTVTSSDCKVKKVRFYEFLFTLG